MSTTAQSTILNGLNRAQIYPNQCPNLGNATASSSSMAPMAIATCQFSFIADIFYSNFWPLLYFFSGYAPESRTKLCATELQSSRCDN